MNRRYKAFWAVDFTDRKTKTLWFSLNVCAASATMAESKARKHALARGWKSTSFDITSVVHKGTIDVF